jgi:hypothetical protein
MYYNFICILYALLYGQNFILVKSGCYRHCGNTTAAVNTTSRTFFREVFSGPYTAKDPDKAIVTKHYSAKAKIEFIDKQEA